MFLSIIFWVIFADLSMLFQSKEEGKDQESIQSSTVKPLYNNHSQKTKMILKTNYALVQVKNIAEQSKGSILQYFRHALSYHLSLRSLFYLFWSSHVTQVLLTTPDPRDPIGKWQ